MKGEVSVRTIKLDDCYQLPATSALQRAVMVMFPLCFSFMLQKQGGNARSLMQNNTKLVLIAPHSQVEKCDNWDSSLGHI